MILGVPAVLFGRIPNKMSQEEFDRLRASAEVLEQDQHGIKVMRLADGDMLKLFRVKRWWSSARWMPYSLRFCRNAQKLVQLGIPTLKVKSVYRLPDSRWTAVIYHPLSGSTLRQIAENGRLPLELIAKLAIFVSNLHKRGIYFRSLHLGNIVQTPEGELGLIDVADMAFDRDALGFLKTRRNLKRLCRLEVDRKCIGTIGWQCFVKSYCDARHFNSRFYPWISASVLRLYGIN